jgi:hypothetical protein
MDVADLERAQLLTPQTVIQQRRQDRPVALPFQGICWWNLEEHPRLVIAERRRHALAVHRARPLHPQHRVMPYRVALAEIGIQRGQRRQFAPNGVVGETLPGELLAPRNDMRTRHVAKRFRLAQTGEGLKIFDVLLVGTSSVRVREIGKPFELWGDVRQILELHSGETGWHSDTADGDEWSH